MSGYQPANSLQHVEIGARPASRLARAGAGLIARDGREDSHAGLAAAVRQAVLPQLVHRNATPCARNGAGARQRLHVEEFTRLLLDEGGHGCETYLDAFLGRDEDPQAAAAYLLAPAARLIGDFWRMDVCDFMAVTVAMTRIQRMFWRMASEHPPSGPARPGHNALLSPVPGEQHGFGLSVVEDALRRAGWHVDCCAAGDGQELMALAARGDYALVGLSLSGEAVAGRLARTIRELRRKNRDRDARIIVGGGIFVDKPELAFLAGADHLALDAQAAVGLAAGVVAGKGGCHATIAAE